MLVLLWFCNLLFLKVALRKHKNQYKLAEASKRLQTRKKFLVINNLIAIVVIAFAKQQSHVYK